MKIVITDNTINNTFVCCKKNPCETRARISKLVFDLQRDCTKDQCCALTIECTKCLKENNYDNIGKN